MAAPPRMTAMKTSATVLVRERLTAAGGVERSATMLMAGPLSWPEAIGIACLRCRNMKASPVPAGKDHEPFALELDTPAAPPIHSIVNKHTCQPSPRCLTPGAPMADDSLIRFP